MSLRMPSSAVSSGGTMSHDMIRFTPDVDTNLVASMSPLRLADSSTPGTGDYGIASERNHVGSLCRHRARRIGDPSAWLDDAASPYATYYCSCRREPRLRATKMTADDDDGSARDVAPPDVAVAPAYGTSTVGVSRPCGHPRQHVVVCTTAGGEKIYQERYKYSTFFGGEEAQSRAARNAINIAMDTTDQPAISMAAATAADYDVTSANVATYSSPPVNL